MTKILFKNDWQEKIGEEYNKSYYQDLRKFLINEYKHYKIFPPMDEIFNALNLTAYEDVKLVILGQDPYHNDGQAHGLSFSVRSGVKIPPSLMNIYKEIHSDLGLKMKRDGDLTYLARQGVLLLNAVLTVRAHEPGSHRKKGWEIFTDNIITCLNEKKSPIVFMLWGNFARSKKSIITNDRHLIIESAHPSPLSASRGFIGSKPFSRANNFLRAQDLEEINWSNIDF